MLPPPPIFEIMLWMMLHVKPWSPQRIYFLFHITAVEWFLFGKTEVVAGFVCVNVCAREHLCRFARGFYSCMVSVREPSVFEVLCCCNIGSSQGGNAPSLPYPCETAVWFCQNWSRRSEVVVLITQLQSYSHYDSRPDSIMPLNGLIFLAVWY